MISQFHSFLGVCIDFRWDSIQPNFSINPNTQPRYRYLGITNSTVINLTYLNNCTNVQTIRRLQQLTELTGSVQVFAVTCIVCLQVCARLGISFRAELSSTREPSFQPLNLCLFRKHSLRYHRRLLNLTFVSPQKTSSPCSSSSKNH